MNIGAQWILRSSEDPLLADAPQASRRAAAPSASAAAPMASATPAASLKPSAQSLQARVPSSAHPAAARLGSSPAPARSAAEEKALSTIANLKPATRAPVAARTPVRAPRPMPHAASAAHEAVADAQLVSEVRTASWEAIPGIVNRCRACMMADTRQHTVCADGAPGCPMVLIGEAPGRDEDLQGIPFVGKSGELLNKILAACGLQRGREVAIVNVLKCRPPRNRDPRPDEAAACAAFLDRQLELLAPQVIVLMGRQAMQRILNRTDRLDALRGKRWTLTVAGREVPVVVTYHPSSLLRNPVDKEKGWHDFIFARSILSEQKSEKTDVSGAST